MIPDGVPVSWYRSNRDWLDRARANWSARPERVVPLHLRMWFTSPIAWDGYHHTQLEGALQMAVVTLETGRTSDDVYAGIGNGFMPPPIPIADVELDDAQGVVWPIACASSAIPAPCAVESMRWKRRRTDAEQMRGTKILIAGGPFKALQIPVATITTPWIDWYVVADRDRLETVLAHVSGLGRDVPRGLGKILGTEVHELEEDRSIMWRGAPMRPIPATNDGGDRDPRSADPTRCEVREVATRAPYWHRASMTLCLTPIIRVGGVTEHDDRRSVA